MIDSPSLGVVKAGQKTHPLMVREFSHLGAGHYARQMAIEQSTLRLVDHDDKNECREGISDSNSTAPLQQERQQQGPNIASTN